MNQQGRWYHLLVVLLVLVMAGLAYSLVIGSALAHQHGWTFAADTWTSVGPARAVAHGRLFFIYQANPYYLYGPAEAVLMAPVVALGGALHLSDNLTNPAHPTLLLLVLPAGLLLAVPMLRAAAALAGGTRARVVGVQVALVGAFVFVTGVVWGHFEDLLALGCLLTSLSALSRGRSGRAALWLGAAILAKQWAVFGLPLLYLAAPRGRRLECLAVSAGPALAFAYFALVLDWPDSHVSLLGVRTWTEYGHVALWSHPSLAGIPVSPYRLVELAGGMLVVCWWLRCDRDPARFTGALALALSLQLLVEPNVFSYLPGAVTALAIVHAAVTGQRFWQPAVLGLGLEAWFMLHPAPLLWWAVAWAILAGLVGFALADLWRMRAPHRLPARLGQIRAPERAGVG
ncbi:MAG: hypothetical protein ACYDB7_05975 [Mycobacteriales bacterium]